MKEESKIMCPKCGSENKELYMTHGQVIGHRWICKDCGKVYEDQETIQSRKKTTKILLRILGVLVIIIIFLAILLSL